MKRFKMLLFASMVMFVSSGVSAAVDKPVYNLGDYVSSDHVGASFSVDVAGSFVDVFNFTLYEDSTFYSLFTGVSESFSFTDLSLFSGYGGLSSPLFSTSSFPPLPPIFPVDFEELAVGVPGLFFPPAPLPPMLTAGDYSLVLTGESFLDSQSYTLNATGSIAPVPEPSTYALMLAGLGLVGFMAVRKRRQ